MGELTLQVSYLILFIWFRCKACFKGFPVIKYIYLACLKVVIWFAFALYRLIVYGLLENNVFRTLSRI